MENNKSSVFMVIYSFGLLLFIQSVIGFFAWTAWQIVAMYNIVPSVPVQAGIAMWMLWFLMFSIPKMFSEVMVKAINSKEDIDHVNKKKSYQ